jgi:hypothetical protein
MVFWFLAARICNLSLPGRWIPSSKSCSLVAPRSAKTLRSRFTTAAGGNDIGASGKLQTHVFAVLAAAVFARCTTPDRDSSHAHEAFRRAGPTHHAFALGMVHLTAGLRLLGKGDWVQSRPLVERGMAEYRRGTSSSRFPTPLLRRPGSLLKSASRAKH